MIPTYYSFRTIKNLIKKNLIRYVDLLKHSLMFVNLKLEEILQNLRLERLNIFLDCIYSPSFYTLKLFKFYY